MMLQAGVAETDITPPLGVRMAGGFKPQFADDVHDPLRCKAVVVDDGEIRLAFVLLDVIGLSWDDVDAIRTRIAHEGGARQDRVMVGCTHTHTGPATQAIHDVAKESDYVEWLIRRAADTVVMAAKRLCPCTVAWGRGEQDDISFCRRYRMRDGTVRMNPGKNNPDALEPTSPIDPDVGVLYFEDRQGVPLAVVAQFGMHYVGTDRSTAISADYYGDFARVMGRGLGANCTTLLFNGSIGQINNINPFDAHQQKGHAQGMRTATALAGEVLKVIGRANVQAEAVLGAASMPVELPRQIVTDADLAVARQILAGDDPKLDVGPFSFVVGQPISPALRAQYARYVLRLAEMPSRLPTEVQVFRIGDAAWVGIPGQSFVEIGFAVKERARSAHVHIVNLANDNLGYFATDRALQDEGGYETWPVPSSPVGMGAEGVLIDAAEKLLNRLF